MPEWDVKCTVILLCLFLQSHSSSAAAALNCFGAGCAPVSPANAIHQPFYLHRDELIDYDALFKSITTEVEQEAEDEKRALDAEIVAGYNILLPAEPEHVDHVDDKFGNPAVELLTHNERLEETEKKMPTNTWVNWNILGAKYPDVMEEPTRKGLEIKQTKTAEVQKQPTVHESESKSHESLEPETERPEHSNIVPESNQSKYKIWNMLAGKYSEEMEEPTENEQTGTTEPQKQPDADPQESESKQFESKSRELMEPETDQPEQMQSKTPADEILTEVKKPGAAEEEDMKHADSKVLETKAGTVRDPVLPKEDQESATTKQGEHDNGSESSNMTYQMPMSVSDLDSILKYAVGPRFATIIMSIIKTDTNAITSSAPNYPQPSAKMSLSSSTLFEIVKTVVSEKAATNVLAAIHSKRDGGIGNDPANQSTRSTRGFQSPTSPEHSNIVPESNQSKYKIWNLLAGKYSEEMEEPTENEQTGTTEPQKQPDADPQESESKQFKSKSHEMMQPETDQPEQMQSEIQSNEILSEVKKPGAAEEEDMKHADSKILETKAGTVRDPVLPKEDQESATTKQGEHDNGSESSNMTYQMPMSVSDLDSILKYAVGPRFATIIMSIIKTDTNAITSSAPNYPQPSAKMSLSSSTLFEIVKTVVSEKAATNVLAAIHSRRDGGIGNDPANQSTRSTRGFQAGSYQERQGGSRYNEGREEKQRSHNRGEGRKSESRGFSNFRRSRFGSHELSRFRNRNKQNQTAQKQSTDGSNRKYSTASYSYDALFDTLKDAVGEQNAKKIMVEVKGYNKENGTIKISSGQLYGIIMKTAGGPGAEKFFTTLAERDTDGVEDKTGQDRGNLKGNQDDREENSTESNTPSGRRGKDKEKKKKEKKKGRKGKGKVGKKEIGKEKQESVPKSLKYSNFSINILKKDGNTAENTTEEMDKQDDATNNKPNRDDVNNNKTEQHPKSNSGSRDVAKTNSNEAANRNQRRRKKTENESGSASDNGSSDSSDSSDSDSSDSSDSDSSSIHEANSQIHQRPRRREDRQRNDSQEEKRKNEAENDPTALWKQQHSDRWNKIQSLLNRQRHDGDGQKPTETVNDEEGTTFDNDINQLENIPPMPIRPPEVLPAETTNVPVDSSVIQNPEHTTENRKTKSGRSDEGSHLERDRSGRDRSGKEKKGKGKGKGKGKSDKQKNDSQEHKRNKMF